MTNSNGNFTNPQRTILYTRVSGEEQQKKGYSLGDQLETLRNWAVENGYEVVEEIEDAGYSGAYLERPGLDKVRELVRREKADAVAVLFRDRIARGVYAQLLSEEFRQNGARLVALNSRGDDSPDGELGDNILDVIAGWERKKISERMNRGKIRKAREGKIVAGPQPNYGYRFNETRDAYSIHEENMTVVRRIFEMVGAQGMTVNSCRCTLENESITSPSGMRRWNQVTVRKLILDDVYLSRHYEEISTMISPEVADRLDKEALYGVWWYGKERHVFSQERVIGADGAPRYRRARKSTPVPESERVAVPVPDSGIPREWVLKAREAVAKNERISNAGHRVWQLTGGVLRCSECRNAMSTNAIPKRNLFYYRCTRHYNGGIAACSANRAIRTDKVEPLVWEFVRNILTDPTRLAEGLEAMIENEASGSRSALEQDEATWLKHVSEIERKEERLLDLRLEGDITTEQYRTKNAGLVESKQAAEGRLIEVRLRRGRLTEIERDKEALLAHYAGLIPRNLDTLEPEERRTIYRMMRLTVLAAPDGSLTAEWGFCNDELTLPDSCCIVGR